MSNRADLRERTKTTSRADRRLNGLVGCKVPIDLVKISVKEATHMGFHYILIHYMVFCRQKIPNKDLSWSKSEKVYSRLYLIKLESIMRALSDALPKGHRAMANPTLQLHFGCGKATPPVNHSHNWPSGRMQIFLFKIGQKIIFCQQTPKN